jgi:hypothetical protein
MANRKFKLHVPMWESVLRIGISFLSGGIFYTAWLVAFLLLNSEGTFINTVLFLIAPFITGLGFGLGVCLMNKILKKNPVPFHKVVSWPILGCIFGAAAVYWFGPMLIVFSMLAAGTVSVIIWELSMYQRT